MTKDNKNMSFIDNDSTIYEIKEIMDCLGRNEKDGDVSGSHLGRILNYLRQQNQEEMKKTLWKLSLMCGMNLRYIRENYLNGLIEFGVIETQIVGNAHYWKWIGKPAFDNKNNGEK